MLLGSKFGCVLLRMMVLKIANLQSKKYPSRPGLGASIKYVHKIFRKTNISNPLIRRLKCAYQGVRNISFSENFAYVLNGWPLWDLVRQLQPKDSATNQKMFTQIHFLEFAYISITFLRIFFYLLVLLEFSSICLYSLAESIEKRSSKRHLY